MSELDLERTPINRKLVAEALRELETADGRLTPETVYESAKSVTSPLHPYFEWDATTAAKAHNLNIARRLISTVRYEVSVSDRGVIRAPVYVRDPNAAHRTQGYVALRNVVTRSPTAHEMIRVELEQALGLLRRAHGIAIVVGLGDKIGTFIEDVENFQVQVESEIALQKAA